MPADETIHIDAAVFAAIDDALRRCRGRTLVSGSDVVDLLLDLRIAIETEKAVGPVLTATAS